MPRRSTHARAGVLAGAGIAAYRSRHATGNEQIAEAVGGALGGLLGGLLPDLLEPATTPNHRSVAHSAVAAGTLSLARLAEWQAECRTAAEAVVKRSLAHPLGSAERGSAEWDAMFWRLLAGFLVGLVAGYGSHVLLDAGTPRGLPFLA
jgi:hypothetical protein